MMLLQEAGEWGFEPQGFSLPFWGWTSPGDKCMMLSHSLSQDVLSCEIERLEKLSRCFSLLQGWEAWPHCEVGRDKLSHCQGVEGQVGSGQPERGSPVKGPDPVLLSGLHPAGRHGSHWAGWSSWTQGRKR